MSFLPIYRLDLTNRIQQRWWDVSSEIRLERMWLCLAHTLALLTDWLLWWSQLPCYELPWGEALWRGKELRAASSQQPALNWMVPTASWMSWEWINLQVSLEMTAALANTLSAACERLLAESLHRLLTNKNYDNQCCFISEGRGGVGRD